jgi:hypothetical protein
VSNLLKYSSTAAEFVFAERPVLNSSALSAPSLSVSSFLKNSAAFAADCWPEAVVVSASEAENANAVVLRIVMSLFIGMLGLKPTLGTASRDYAPYSITGKSKLLHMFFVKPIMAFEDKASRQKKCGSPQPIG